jgi:hypothetical protein
MPVYVHICSSDLILAVLGLLVRCRLLRVKIAMLLDSIEK